METQSNAAGQADQRAAMIAEAAYFAAEKRNFQPGGELADWLAAERFVDLELEGEKRVAKKPTKATAKKPAKKKPAKKKAKAATKKTGKAPAKKAAGKKTAAKKKATSKVARKAATKKAAAKKSAKR